MTQTADAIANAGAIIASLARESEQQAAEIERLRAVLFDIRKFLSNPEWGTVRYMEGSGVYTEKDDALRAVNGVLGEDGSNG